MIRLKDILNEIENGEQVSIGDGYLLRRLGALGNLFKVYDTNNEVALSAYVILKHIDTEPLKIPYVFEVDVQSGHKGKGLYRRILPILRDTFGAIRSSNEGPISDEAEKAWKAVGARKLLRTDDHQLYGNSWYVLEK